MEARITQKFKVTEGPHKGEQGRVDMIYYDHLHTGESPDLVMGQLDAGGYWKGTTEMCRVLDPESLEGRSETMEEHIMQFFGYDHLPERLQLASKPFHDLAHHITEMSDRSPERTVALRKLLESKDAAVRAVLCSNSTLQSP